MEIHPTLEVTTPADFAAWLAEHGATAHEIWPIIYKKSSGKQTVTYPQLVEVGICYGWIDVLEKTVDSERYAIRFMPRRKGSNWTEANRALARRFIAEGRMTEAGKAALPPDLLGCKSESQSQIAKTPVLRDTETLRLPTLAHRHRHHDRPTPALASAPPVRRR